MGGLNGGGVSFQSGSGPNICELVVRTSDKRGVSHVDNEERERKRKSAKPNRIDNANALSPMQNIIS